MGKLMPDPRLANRARAAALVADVAPAKNRGGFTLVELLVTLALTLFILALFTSLFVSATGSISSLKGIAGADQRVRMAVTMIRKDLTDAFIKVRPVVAAGSSVAGTPAAAFYHRPDGTEVYRPQEGYFLIEENSPAIRQGLDAWGIPVEVDVDDVLAFTGQRSGLNRAEVYYGRVPRGTTLDQPANTLAPFDKAGDGLCTSTTAEIVYFLRPDRRQYALDEIRGHNAGTPWTEATLFTPVTYTLYRRQLLVLGPQPLVDRLNSPTGDPQFPNILAERSLNTTFTNGAQTYDGQRYYFNYDVAGKPDITNPNLIHFAGLADMAQRRFRFGISHDPLGTGNEFPFSWCGSNAANRSSVTGAYYQSANGAPLPQWMGRPIVLETNCRPVGDNIFNVLNQFFSDPTKPLDITNASTSTQNGILDSNNLTTDAVTPVDTAFQNQATIPYPYGGDILLSNVLSFDVKVYDDDPRFEPTPATGPAIASLPTAAINPLRATGFADQRAPEYVDLGYRGEADLLTGGATVESHYLAATGDYYGFVDFFANKYLGPQTRWRNIGLNTAGSIAPPGRPLPAFFPNRTYDTWADDQNVTFVPPLASGLTSDYSINPADAATARFRPIPYPKPLRSIQIRLRVLEPNSGFVREVTIEHTFDWTPP